MSVIVNPPNPANTVVVTPPSGGNLVTVLAGIAGPTGPANSLDVLSTTTGAPGSSANVVVSGTAPTQHLAFTIPSGLKGDKGDKGDTGATGASNTLSVGGTTTGAAGTNAIASLSGTSPDQTLYFTIPAGANGGIPEAPIDGSLYARKDGAWDTISVGNPFDQSLNTTDDVQFNSVSINAGVAGIDSLGNTTLHGLGVGGNLGYVGMEHTMEIVAPSGSSPLVIQGGTGVVEFWGPVFASGAGASFGLGIPGAGSSEDFVFSRFNGGWSEVFRLVNADGSVSFAQGLASFDSLGNLTAANFPQTIPVTSVAGKTGAVTLSASDVGAASVAQSIAFSIALS